MKTAFLLVTGLPILISGFYQAPTSAQLKCHKIDIKKDSTYTIVLNASFGEGYQWKLKTILDSSCVALEKETNKTANDKDGGHDIQEFLIRGKKKGIITLEFIYVQPWLMEKSKKYSVQTFSISVK